MSVVRCRPLRRSGARPPLFLVVAPEVNPLGYTALARCLPPEESPVLVQPDPTGRGQRVDDYEPAEIAALAAEYLAAVRAHRPEGPYLLAGMCDGAHIAFEMARTLAAEGESPALLAILDTWPVENSSRFSLLFLEGLRRIVPRLRGRGIVGLARTAVTALRRLRSPEQQRWRARVWPGRAYRPPVYGGRITVIRVEHQAYYRVSDPSLGWAARSALPVDLHVVSGGHQSLLRRPHVLEVARALGAALAKSRAAPEAHLGAADRASGAGAV